MAIKKSDRQKIYEKYNGHCAYCGKEIALKDMQVDHIEPLRNWDRAKTQEELNNIKNFNPSCRMCNHYKRADNLEAFRESMSTLHKRISKLYIVRVGIDHGIINIKPFDGKFYFEKIVTNR
ncbi:HNH endonuclease [Ruminiclostridium sufflavum DSM 19573]|uniref:HNH endonuclease n=1 Tax=Ruminiclostridium sufflavum DSM 19573 TaxID=1121337 RepID=A0A318XLH7_9FIRM|nr:HNH endonuclease signature motif containing protein [Ruminiclostridium sufflavum]PYG88483.1 HNH endonuclease [Ruminiclostridium sufflavum DSM 19573]